MIYIYDIIYKQIIYLISLIIYHTYNIQIYHKSYTAIFIYLAFSYLAEAVVILLSPRRYILDFLILAAALSGNGQSAKSQVFTTSILPYQNKINKSSAAAANFLFLNFASYHSFFNTQTQHSKFGHGSGRILNFEFRQQPSII